MDGDGFKRLGLVQAALVLCTAFIVLGWLYLILVGIRPPSRTSPR